MEFITDVSLIINEDGFKDLIGLMKILKSFRPERKGSCYTVTGSFEDMENLWRRLSAFRDCPSPQKYRLTNHYQPSSPRFVDVSRSVMDYMEQKCVKQLTRITGSSFIEKQPGESSSSVRVIFRTQDGSVSPVHADFIRQRFITFYQRTASDLQTTYIDPRHLKELERRFPQLLFQPHHIKHKVKVTGNFVEIHQLKQLLSRNTTSSSRSPKNNKHPAESSRSSGTSPELSRGPEEKEVCPICMEQIKTSERETLKCKHSFCKDCLKTAFDYKPVCPTCGAVYGVLTGTQPEGGRMKVSKDTSSLPGYEKYGTITINYYIPNGTQKSVHPNPGQPYEGVYRTAYLPDSTEGRQIMELLKRAFDQRLVFTVGRSTTSGRNNTVTWNDIHHKTSRYGGPTQYGYPDPDYLSRVRDELKVKGIE
ncbi:E3 ubiquitin-protein ligase DTX3L [Xyrichtys novacula]|uniref:E3 ubiquitin-protein ligase n=1 Tax=Xyrichtys novacula TaxID=13765 RepID=A0AAV1G5A4_XYRNO|nr:E3 ubiquitin-protein ligase DTX3L [Xyrichtys novacula]